MDSLATGSADRISFSVACVGLLCAAIALVGCDSNVLLGEMDAAAADADAGDSGEPDGSTELLDCGEGMLCAQSCGADLVCAARCETRVCSEAADAFANFRDCGLEGCIAQCSDFGSDACVECIAAQCPLQALACLNAEC